MKNPTKNDNKKKWVTPSIKEIEVKNSSGSFDDGGNPNSFPT